VCNVQCAVKREVSDVELCATLGKMAICGPNKVPATAQIAAMSSCSCDECIQLGT
jgi:hypothetical protein